MAVPITLSSTDKLTAHRRHYDVAVDGVARGEVLLEHHFKPVANIDGDDVAIWAGSDLAVAPRRGGAFRQVALPEPLLNVYRIRAGWLAVAEISVYVLNDALSVVARRIHDEVLMRSFWADGRLVVHDFAGRTLHLDVDEDALSVSEFT